MSNALNLQEINQEEALSLTRFFLKSGQNIALFGRSGVGKTHIGLEAAKDLKLGVSYLNLSTLSPNDLMGFPSLFEPGEIVTFKSPYYLPKLKGNEKATQILLCDEVDKADPEIFAPLLELLQFRTINGQKVNVAGCILTGNLPEEHSYSHQVSAALLDRCAKYVLTFDLEKWMVWAQNHGVHDLILGFLASNPDCACGPIDTGLACATPSPRSWTLASDALFTAKTHKLIDIATITQIVSGFVGQECGLKFRIWYEHYRHFEPSILSMLENGGCTIDFGRLTTIEQMVFCVSACHLARLKFLQESKGSRPKYQAIENLCAFIVKQQVAPEIQTLCLNNSFPLTLVTNPKYKLYNCHKFFSLLSSLSTK